jgi:hypothetical protein
MEGEGMVNGSKKNVRNNKIVKKANETALSQSIIAFFFFKIELFVNEVN